MTNHIKMSQMPSFKKVEVTTIEGLSIVDLLSEITETTDSSNPDPSLVHRLNHVRSITIPHTVRAIDHNIIDGFTNLEYIDIQGQDNVDVQKDSFKTYDDDDVLVIHTKNQSIFEKIKNIDTIQIKTLEIQNPYLTSTRPTGLLNSSRNLISSNPLNDFITVAGEQYPIINVVRNGLQKYGTFIESGEKSISAAVKTCFEIDWSDSLDSLKGIGKMVINTICEYIPIVGKIYSGIATVVALLKSWFPTHILRPEIRYEFHLPSTLMEFDFESLPELTNRVLENGSYNPQVVTILLPMFEDNFKIYNFNRNKIPFYRLILPPKVIERLYGIDSLVDVSDHVQMIIPAISPFGPGSEFFEYLYNDMVKVGQVQLDKSYDPLNPVYRIWSACLNYLRLYPGMGVCSEKSSSMKDTYPTMSNQIAYYCRYSDPQCYAKKGIEKNMPRYSRYYRGSGPDVSPRSIIDDYETFMYTEHNSLNRAFLPGPYENVLFSEMKFVSGTNDDICLLSSGRYNEVSTLNFNDKQMDKPGNPVEEPKGYYDDPVLADITWNTDLINQNFIQYWFFNTISSTDKIFYDRVNVPTYHDEFNRLYILSKDVPITLLQLYPLNYNIIDGTIDRNEDERMVGYDLLQQYTITATTPKDLYVMSWDRLKSWGTWPTQLRPNGTTHFDLAQHIIDLIRSPSTNYWIKNENPFYPKIPNGNALVFGTHPIQSSRSGREYRLIFSTLKVTLEDVSRTILDENNIEQVDFVTVPKRMSFYAYDLKHRRIIEQEVDLNGTGNVDALVCLTSMSLKYTDTSFFYSNNTQKMEFHDLPSYVYLQRLNLLKASSINENPDTVAKVVAINWDSLQHVIHGEHFFVPHDVQYFYFAPIESAIRREVNHSERLMNTKECILQAPGQEYFKVIDNDSRYFIYDPYLQDFDGYTKFKFRENFRGVVGYDDFFFSPFLYGRDYKDRKQTEYVILYRNHTSLHDPSILQPFYTINGGMKGLSFMKDPIWNIVLISWEPDSREYFEENRHELLKKYLKYMDSFGKKGYLAIVNYFERTNGLSDLYYHPMNHILIIKDGDQILYRETLDSEIWYVYAKFRNDSNNREEYINSTFMKEQFSNDNFVMDCLFIEDEFLYFSEANSNHQVYYFSIKITSNNTYEDIEYLDVSYHKAYFTESFTINLPSKIIGQNTYYETTFVNPIIIESCYQMDGQSFFGCTFNSGIFFKIPIKDIRIDPNAFFNCIFGDLSNLGKLCEVHVMEDVDSDDVRALIYNMKLTALFFRVIVINDVDGSRKGY